LISSSPKTHIKPLDTDAHASVIDDAKFLIVLNYKLIKILPGLNLIIPM